MARGSAIAMQRVRHGVSTRMEHQRRAKQDRAFSQKGSLLVISTLFARLYIPAGSALSDVRWLVRRSAGIAYVIHFGHTHSARPGFIFHAHHPPLRVQEMRVESRLP